MNKTKPKTKQKSNREGKYLLHAPLFYDLLPPCRVISLWPCPHRHYFRKLRNQNPACRWERGRGRTTCTLLIQSYTQEIHCGSTSAILTHKNSCCCIYPSLFHLLFSPAPCKASRLTIIYGFC